MDVMYCGDAGIVRGVMYSMVSLLRRAAGPLDFHVVTAGYVHNGRRFEAVSAEQAGRLERVARAYRPGARVTLHDVSREFACSPPRANMGTRFTPGCMVRLYADLVEGLPDKVLYLDYDVLAAKDPAELLATDMEGLELAGVPDHYGQWLFMGGPAARQYMNSGVLLLNLGEMRRTRLLERCRRRCADTHMFMPDQTALNKLATGKLLLPRRFNEQRRLGPDTVLQHFCTSWRLAPVPHTTCVKPWERERMHAELGLYEYDDLLDECARWEGELQ